MQKRACVLCYLSMDLLDVGCHMPGSRINHECWEIGWCFSTVMSNSKCKVLGYSVLSFLASAWFELDSVLSEVTKPWILLKERC